MAESTLTLGYWPFGGLAQPARYIFEYYKVPFTNKTYTDRETWFGTDKPALNTPLANLPYIKDGDVVITESVAVYQYAALKANPELRGKTDLDKIYVSQVYGVLCDLKEKVVPLAFNPDFEKIKVEKLKETVDPLLAKLSSKLGDQEYLIGYITYVDFIAFYFCEMLQRMNAPTLEAYPNLVKLVERFNNNENIKAYKASDRYNKGFLPPSAGFSGN